MARFPLNIGGDSHAESMMTSALSSSWNQLFAGLDEREMYKHAGIRDRWAAKQVMRLHEYEVGQLKRTAEDQKDEVLSQGNRLLAKMNAARGANNVENSGSALEVEADSVNRMYEDISAIDDNLSSDIFALEYDARSSALDFSTSADINDYYAGQSLAKRIYGIGDTLMSTREDMQRLGIWDDLWEEQA